MNNSDQIKIIAKKELENVTNAENLENWRVKYLGRKSVLMNEFKKMKDMSVNERIEQGKILNGIKKHLEDLFNSKEIEIRLTMDSKRRDVDLSLPVRRHNRGHLHILSQEQKKMTDIFGSMGFNVEEGYEVESEYYNFDALNIPADHPARDMWDTFWLDGSCIGNKESDSKNKYLLRTHTSPMQARYLESHNPPIRLIVPGKCFRYEATDSSHEIQFHQLEGLMVDKDISVANFIAIIEIFLKDFFGKPLKIRLRPSYFPFVEPGFEVDMKCVKCSGKGCSVCKSTGWLEVMGAGMVHQKVFDMAGFTRGEWRGFAFGMGIERLVMLKYNIGDIRLFHSGDLRFIKQF